jgi:TetR/AcrR family transcriptional regulator, transcriptional repressor for nem operon
MKDTKQHILDVALKLFLQKTFKEVTMLEIVKTTGLSKGAFYHYFSSKEELFSEVLNTFIKSTMDVKWETFPMDSLRNFLDYFIVHSGDSLSQITLDTDQVFNVNYFSLFFDGLKLNPEFKTSLIKHHKLERDTWTKVVGNARKRGEIQSTMTDEQIARIFLAISDGAMLTLILEKNKVEISMMKTIKVLWDGFYSQIKA